MIESFLIVSSYIYVIHMHNSKKDFYCSNNEYGRISDLKDL